ncbi:hypothetical protein BC941DRAFT_131279 [Chlamydoabsidia padenii]|nr:hypothetical protein BC941DRAFT_131279 [Chlamydoabsidia padenii]
MLDTDSILSTTSMTSYPKDSSTSTTTTAITRIQPDDDLAIFTFKFNYRNKIYRCQSSPDRFDVLYQLVQTRLGRHGFSLFYMDEDNDQVVMTCDADVMDAVRMARFMGQERVLLFVAFDDDDKIDQDSSRYSYPLLVPTAITVLGVLLLGVLSKAKSHCRL